MPKEQPHLAKYTIVLDAQKLYLTRKKKAWDGNEIWERSSKHFGQFSNSENETKRTA